MNDLTVRIRRKIGRLLRRANPARLGCPRVLVAGVYLADRKNLIRHIVQELGESRLFRVTQRWAAVGGPPPAPHVTRATALRPDRKIPKFQLLNRLLAGIPLEKYAFVLVCDDDIQLPAGFLDEFLTLQQRYDFALAQPARTPNSHLDHAIVRQVPGMIARQTRFVEIGPLFSIRQDALPLLLPFPDTSPMGWGLDFVWPVILERQGLRLGIVDQTPVRHSLRPPAKAYREDAAFREMESFLAATPHLSREEALQVIAEYKA
ncbi:hypothetical protein MIT9_P1704 [Methylomarinovum caldicuralii]|uniref:Glycosyltransferase n=1 Tax=Methylomarinovum caldicuralii TaxID=438856 RepID=A0AAU9C4P4_9GAMM|nr:hypothetical protein [Methylomarinovum caldicuralii]BCX82119.1 hypothetical protein MIT9_P1704 [Methylomarinovum caldicuralii]